MEEVAVPKGHHQNTVECKMLHSSLDAVIRVIGVWPTSDSVALKETCCYCCSLIFTERERENKINPFFFFNFPLLNLVAREKF